MPARHTPPPPLEACDTGCPAAALVHVQRGGLVLAFCGHCFDDRLIPLFREGWEVKTDNRPILRKAEEGRR